MTARTDLGCMGGGREELLCSTQYMYESCSSYDNERFDRLKTTPIVLHVCSLII